MNERKTDYGKVTMIMSVVCAVCCAITALAIVISCLSIVPKVNAALEKTDVLITEASEELDEIRKIDFEQTKADVDELISEARSDLNRLSDDIESLNISGLGDGLKELNTSIENLRSILSNFRLW